MSSLNQCNFIGRMGRDPEVRVTANGTKVAQFSIGCSEKFRDASGSQKENTEWINVVVWKNLADIVEKIGRKGQLVLVSGKMQTTSWDDPSGQKKYKTEVVGRQWQILSDPNFKGQDENYNQENPNYNKPIYNQTSVEDDLPF